MATEEQRNLSSWKGFYTLVSPADMENSVVGYLPSISQSPAKIETHLALQRKCKPS